MKIVCFVALLAVVFAASCGGSSDQSEQEPTVSETSMTQPVVATTLQTTTTIDPIRQALWETIDANSLAVIEVLESDYFVADDFDRCEIYAPEVLNRLLTNRFKLTFADPGQDISLSDQNSGSCFWDTSPDSEIQASVLVRLAGLPPEVINGEEQADATMLDGAVFLGDTWRCQGTQPSYAWADPVWEMLSSTDGPGIAFRVNNVIGQTNVIPLLPDADIDQQAAELVLAQNIARRLGTPEC